MDQRLAQLSISVDDSIRAAMVAIDRGSCEIALAVDDGDVLVGTLSDGDVRRALLAGATLDDPVGPYVVKTPFVVGPAARRAEVIDMMRARYIAQVPIVDEAGRLLGMHLLADLVGFHDRPNWALILAGGRGTRLAPLTETVPKPMVAVAGRPILERLVLHLVGYGVRDIVLSVNYLSEMIEAHFGDGSAFGCRIHYLHEDTALGTGGPLPLLRTLPDAERALAQPLVVMNGDLVTDFDLPELLQRHETAGAVMTLAVRRHTHTVPFGVVDHDDLGYATAIHEKPVHVWPINAGVYVVDPGLVGRVPAGTEYPITALVDDCLGRGERVAVWSLDDDWLDVGRVDDLRRARGEV